MTWYSSIKKDIDRVDVPRERPRLLEQELRQMGSNWFEPTRAQIRDMAGEIVILRTELERLTTASEDRMDLGEVSAFLNVSPDYIVRLLNEGVLKLRTEDVEALKAEKARETKKALDELVRLTEEVGGYDVEETENEHPRVALSPEMVASLLSDE